MNLKQVGIIVLLLFVDGCARSRYKGWEFVRVENTLPSPDCQFKVQENCSKLGNGCFDWFKKRATVFNANTVVVTKTSELGSTSEIRPFHKRTGTLFESLANYYDCPKSN